ncbi:MAG: sulfotransferase [Bacteroidales bacterium]
MKKLLKTHHFLSGLKPEDIRWLLEFGMPKKQGTIYDLRASGFRELPAPVFFLSTGRCGTKWFSGLLEKDRAFKVLHDPAPSLGAQGKAIYEYYVQKNRAINAGLMLFGKEIFLAGREGYLRHSFKSGRRLFETNNHITFFAPMLAALFPQAKFIHLYRHPGEFVRSGLRRKYYQGSPEDARRIIPFPGEKWKNLQIIEKIAFLWYETNRFIEEFKGSVAGDRILDFNFNQLNMQTVRNLLDFSGCGNVSAKRIQQRLHRPVNVQKNVEYPHYQDWPEEDKMQLRSICRPLAEKYGYAL